MNTCTDLFLLFKYRETFFFFNGFFIKKYLKFEKIEKFFIFLFENKKMVMWW